MSLPSLETAFNFIVLNPLASQQVVRLAANLVIRLTRRLTPIIVSHRIQTGTPR
jgi:hypothetical protein